MAEQEGKGGASKQRRPLENRGLSTKASTPDERLPLYQNFGGQSMQLNASLPVSKDVDTSQFNPKDRFSTLELDLQVKILMHLPLIDAVRTCALSTYWRNLWKVVKHLKFDKDFAVSFVKIEHPAAVDVERYFQMISTILNQSLFHSSAKKVTVFVPSQDPQKVGSLLRHMSEMGIGEVSLFFAVRCEKLSPTLFCRDLKSLELVNCNFLPDPEFGGFNKLLSLCLRNVGYKSFEFERFLTRCPLMESLLIQGCNRISSRNIHRLDLAQFFSHLLLLKDLEVSADFLQVMVSRGVANRPHILYHLKSLRIGNFSFGSVDHFSAILYLISCGPNLNALTLDQGDRNDLDPTHVERYWGSIDLSSVSFKHLREVRLLKFCGCPKLGVK